jgi:hypothetical protein
MPAKAEDGLGAISERIESTFDLVIENSVELAVRLPRRALARRFGGEQPARVQPLAYDAIEDLEDNSSEVGNTALEEGSADEEDDTDTARLPRPRPIDPSEPSVPVAETETAIDDPMGGPLDLVAGAPDPEGEGGIAAPVLGEEIWAGRQLAAVAPEAAAADPDVAPKPTSQIAELIASGECLSLSDVTDRDGDFERNSSALSQNTFCIAEEKFKERRRHWRIATVKTGRPGPLFVVMHDDEDMSFDTAVAALNTYGGTLVALETGGKRNQDGIDPNRNFSADGIGCRKLGRDAAPKYTGIFRRHIDPTQPIIALHNNTGKRIPTGGLGHVSMTDLPKGMQAHESSDPDGPLAGERALVLLTSAAPVSTTSKTEAAELAARGINAVIESVSEGKGDCSLSNYAVLSGHEDYFNVTVDKDERDKQRKIIDVIMAGRNATVATQ